MKPTIVQGEGITLVLGACSHDNEQTTVGPTTDQINHWCPDCRKFWTTWADRGAGVAKVAITDAMVEAGAAALAGSMDCPRNAEWGRRWARKVLEAARGVALPDGAQQ